MAIRAAALLLATTAWGAAALPPPPPPPTTAAIVGTAVALPCDASDAFQTQWSVNDGGIGVISIASGGCLNNNGAGQPADVRGCVGGDKPEIGYNLTAGAPPRQVVWAASGLCLALGAPAAAAATSEGAAAAALPLTLAPCSGAPPLFAFSAANRSITVLPDGAQPPLCLSVQPPAPPLLSTVFGDHMVLQAGQPFALWGYAAPGSAVTATVAGQARAAAPDPATGVWVAAFSAVPAGGPFTVNVSSTLASGAPGPSAGLVDVMFGLVLFASGQSNLSGGNTPLKYVFNASQEIAQSADFPSVRILSVGTSGSGAPAPLPFLGAPPHIPWSVASPASTPGFSAVAWLTTKAVAEALGNGTAVGVIESAWGGTSIQVWLDASAAAGCGDAPAYPGGWPTAPSSLFNAMVAPFLVGPMRVGGFVWYQGESNALNAQAGYYDCALPALITSWRAAFASPGAWVGVAQLAPWASSPAADNEAVAELRASQLRTGRALPNVTVATAADGGDPGAPAGSIHPRGKQHLGARLGAGAVGALLTGAGAQPPEAVGPIAVSVAPGGGPPGTLSATVSFAGVDAASNRLVLVAPQPVGPLANSSVCPAGVNASLCAGFQLQDAAGAWYPATGTLTPDATQLVLTAAPAPGGPAPPPGAVLNATASGWSLWPITLLYSSRGVPAFPWRLGVGGGAAGA